MFNEAFVDALLFDNVEVAPPVTAGAGLPVMLPVQIDDDDDIFLLWYFMLRG